MKVPSCTAGVGALTYQQHAAWCCGSSMPFCEEPPVGYRAKGYRHALKSVLLFTEPRETPSRPVSRRGRPNPQSAALLLPRGAGVGATAAHARDAGASRGFAAALVVVLLVARQGYFGHLRGFEAQTSSSSEYQAASWGKRGAGERSSVETFGDAAVSDVALQGLIEAFLFGP
ncbi:hypothetical protein PG997_000630 [Apiospora hydei]|uniref:Uncharacterized protein n=1 Tax=Apiospora hydei TaxID=1337664 RepID=A0ABR1XBC6_9PEZI